MIDNVKVTRTTQTSRFTDAGTVEEIIVTEFKIGTHGPFTIRTPLAGYNQAAVEQQIMQLKLTVDGLTR
jgi:hypothetical protein